MRRLALGLLALCLLGAPATADTTPIQQDPMGRLSDVTDRWTDYQPADSYCVTIDGFDLYRAITGDAGPTCGGDEGTFMVTIGAPSLCPGCRRFFIDYSAIKPNDPANGLFYAHGHVYFRMQSFNPTYTADPIAHSPNIKNFTNDKAIAPYGSPQEQIATGFDTHAISYVGDTKYFHQNNIQGPYYIGPSYVNREGVLINGAYVDIDVSGAYDMRNGAVNGIGYWSGFDSGEPTCLHNMSDDYADGDAFYFGCTPHPGISSVTIDPFA